MKTVHGAEFYANKKHKGGNSGGDSTNSGGNGGGGMGVGDGASDEAGAGDHSSPSRSEDHPKTPSLSSPSVKSESEANSPPSIIQQQSPLHVAACADDVANLAIGSISGDTVGIIEEPWNEEPTDDLDIADLPVALRAMVIFHLFNFVNSRSTLRYFVPF